jgi:hypothetical protein
MHAGHPLGKPTGASALTIYNWDTSKVRSKKDRLAVLIAVRKVGKREAMQTLEMFQLSKKPR